MSMFFLLARQDTLNQLWQNWALHLRNSATIHRPLAVLTARPGWMKRKRKVDLKVASTASCRAGPFPANSLAWQRLVGAWWIEVGEVPLKKASEREEEGPVVEQVTMNDGKSGHWKFD
jgi:hypothetical protein